MTANAIKDHELAVLVGESPGEICNDLGEVTMVRLPNSGISTWIPSALFVRANGDEKDLNPVLPDIYIKDIDNMDRKVLIKKVLKEQ